MNQQIEEHIENCETTLDLQIRWDQFRKIMEFQGLTPAKVARMSKTPERTVRNIMDGLTKDPRISTAAAIARSIGASLDRIVGIAPMRDFKREEAVYDATLMDSMREQVKAAKNEIAARDVELDRLRKLILEKEGDMRRFEGRANEFEKLSKQCADQQERLEAKADKIREQAEVIASQDVTIKEQRKEIMNLEKTAVAQKKELSFTRAILSGLIVLIVVVAVYMAWELTNQDMGNLQFRK